MDWETHQRANDASGDLEGEVKAENVCSALDSVVGDQVEHALKQGWFTIMARSQDAAPYILGSNGEGKRLRLFKSF